MATRNPCWSEEKEKSDPGGGTIWVTISNKKNAAVLKRRNLACSKAGNVSSAQCPYVFVACPGEGGIVCVQCPSVVPVCTPVLGVMEAIYGQTLCRNRGGLLTCNSNDTGYANGIQKRPARPGKYHGQTLSDMRGGLLPRKGGGAGRASRTQGPKKDHGQT